MDILIMTSYFKSGTWNSVCAVCGFEFKADQLQKRWDGVYVCDKDMEPRHELDFFKVPAEKDQTVPWTQHDDNEEAITVDTDGSVAVAASLTSTSYFFSGDGGLSQVSLPAANHATFLGLSVEYLLNNQDTSEDYVMTSTSTIDHQGLGTTVYAGTTARVRNIPSTNTWIRLL